MIPAVPEFGGSPNETTAIGGNGNPELPYVKFKRFTYVNLLYENKQRTRF